MLQFSSGILFLPLLFLFAQCHPSPPDVSKHRNHKLFDNLTCGELITDKNRAGNYPWSALLQNSDDHFYCQGSIIHDRYILTAANCVQNGKGLKQVRVGAYNLNKLADCPSQLCDEKNIQDLEIESIHIHPEYSPNTKDNDIALLRLKQNIILTPEIVQPVCLPFKMQNLTYPTTEVHGWGLMSDPSFTRLQKMFVKNIDNKLCKEHHQGSRNISYKQICTVVDSKYNFCIEDNGAPLIDDKLEFVQVGVASFENSCSSKSPNVYTSIVYYLDWILDTMKA